MSSSHVTSFPLCMGLTVVFSDPEIVDSKTCLIFTIANNMPLKHASSSWLQINSICKNATLVHIVQPSGHTFFQIVYAPRLCVAAASEARISRTNCGVHIIHRPHFFPCAFSTNFGSISALIWPLSCATNVSQDPCLGAACFYLLPSQKQWARLN